MSETVTKVVQGVDSLFDEIVINGRTVKSTPSGRATHTTQSSPAPVAEPVEGQYVGAVQLNDVIHGLKDVPLTQRVSSLENGVRSINELIPSSASSANKLTDKSYVDNADSGLQTDITNIGAEVTALQTLLGTIQQRLTELNAMIPNQASAQNQLADKDFVNSSISTNTANFLGTYSTLAEIEAIQNPTNNDYAFLETTDASGNTVFDRYKYSGADSQWLFEYELNNSSFTAEQWATINSGLTQNSVDTSIENAINALDVASSGGSGKYISAIEQIDGKISAMEGTIDSAPTSGSDNPVSSDGVYQALHNAGGSVKYITTASTISPVVITNAPAISTGDIVKIWFYSSLYASNGTTGMTITYNGTNYAVKVDKGGTLANFTAWAGNGTNYLYFTANKVIDFLFNGTNFIIEGLPVVQSSAGSNFARLADGFIAPSLTNMNNQLLSKLGKLASGTINPSIIDYIPISSAGAYLVSAVSNSNSGVGALFIPYIGGAFYWSNLGSYGNFPLNVGYSGTNGITIRNNNSYDSVIYSVIKLT